MQQVIYKYEKNGTIFQTYIDPYSAEAMVCGMKNLWFWETILHNNKLEDCVFIARNDKTDAIVSLEFPTMSKQQFNSITKTLA